VEGGVDTATYKEAYGVFGENTRRKKRGAQVAESNLANKARNSPGSGSEDAGKNT